MVSEAEASRVGLSVRDVPGLFGNDAAGAQVQMRIAIADHVAVGDFQLEHAVFLVVGNDKMPFVELPPDSQGVLGIPVLLDMERIRWNSDGVFEIGFPAPAKGIARANLCFDGANLVVSGEFQQTRINFFLDTGATKTRLSPLFAEDFADLIRERGNKATAQVRGVGGSAEVEAYWLPEVKFRIGGFDAVLQPVEVLTKDAGGPGGWYHVWAGLDLFRHARRVTIDFRAMRLAAE